MDCKPRNSHKLYYISVFMFLLVAASALLLLRNGISKVTSPVTDMQHSSSSAKVGFSVQDIKPILKGEKVGALFESSNNNNDWLMRMSVTIRRILSGPGSSPPRCTNKCGRCSPCKPVHVPVPPGTPVPTEYYPEAWKCKCGNKYYMP